MTTPNGTKTRNAPDAFTQAGKLARRLEQIGLDETAELAKSPDEIRAKYDRKRTEAKATIPTAIVTMAETMLASKSAPASPDPTPSASGRTR